MNKAMFSNNKNDWETPQDFFEELNKEFSFTLDPCANEHNHKCNKYYTEEVDGLKQDWSGEVVFAIPHTLTKSKMLG